MTEIYLYTLLSVIAVSVISLIGVLALSFKEHILQKSVFILVSLAVGALFGDAFIHLIPEALSESSNETITSILIIVGILLFFVMEKFLHWHHSHGDDDDIKLHHKNDKKKQKGNIHPTGYMILVSDGVHNFLDGIIVAVSYMVSIEVGIATTLAIVLHEIPQEIGDFGVLIHAGFSKVRALFMNFLSALLAIFGAVLALLLGEGSAVFAHWIIPIAAGGFIYIAGSDLIPELHKTRNIKSSFIQFLALLVGVLAMFLLVFFEG